MTKNSNKANIDAWIRQAFEQAGEQASAIEVIVGNIKELLDEKNGEILDAWADISIPAYIVDICTMAEEDDDFAETIDNLLKMSVIAGYLTALDDIRNGRLKGFV